ncbi:MAG: (d)CMP kinase [Sporichthyaceae bacterium]
MDGPSGSGKSSASRGVAQDLGVRYLDTGAQYRAMTWWMLENGVDLADPEAVAALAGKPVLFSDTDPNAPGITVDGHDVSGPIRTPEVTAAVGIVSAVPAVRARLVAMQQAIIARCCADDGGIVVEGRDIGTVVAPDAPVKIFLTASAEARANRRSAEFAAAGTQDVSVEATQAELARRDRLDSSRKVAPLLQAADAIELDATALNLEQVIAAVLEQVRRVQAAAVDGVAR